MSWRDETGTLKFRGGLSALTFLGAFTSEEWWEEEEEKVRRKRRSKRRERLASYSNKSYLELGPQPLK